MSKRSDSPWGTWSDGSPQDAVMALKVVAAVAVAALVLGWIGGMVA